MQPFLSPIEFWEVFPQPSTPENSHYALCLLPLATICLSVKEFAPPVRKIPPLNSKWLGVRGTSSVTSSLHLVKGRELMILSTSQNTVCKISSVKRPQFVSTAIKTFRMVLIWRSHTPPWWEAKGGLNIHSTSRRRAAAITFSRSKLRRLLASSILAPTKFVPLSDHTFRTSPWRVTNLINPFMKLSVSRLSSFSICTALELKQVKGQPYRFTSARPSLTYRGPNKSRPT